LESIADDEFECPYKRAFSELRSELSVTLESMRADIKQISADWRTGIKSISDEMHAGFLEIEAMLTELNTIPSPAPITEPVKLPWYRRTFE
jgi:hypothetical protein